MTRYEVGRYWEASVRAALEPPSYESTQPVQGANSSTHSLPVYTKQSRGGGAILIRPDPTILTPPECSGVNLHMLGFPGSPSHPQTALSTPPPYHWSTAAAHVTGDLEEQQPVAQSAARVPNEAPTVDMSPWAMAAIRDVHERRTRPAKPPNHEMNEVVFTAGTQAQHVRHRDREQRVENIDFTCTPMNTNILPSNSPTSDITQMHSVGSRSIPLFASNTMDDPVVSVKFPQKACSTTCHPRSMVSSRSVERDALSRGTGCLYPLSVFPASRSVTRQ